MKYILKLAIGIYVYLMILMCGSFALEHWVAMGESDIDHKKYCYDKGYEYAINYYETHDDFYIKGGCGCDYWQKGFDDSTKLCEEGYFDDVLETE